MTKVSSPPGPLPRCVRIEESGPERRMITRPGAGRWFIGVIALAVAVGAGFTAVGQLSRLSGASGVYSFVAPVAGVIGLCMSVFLFGLALYCITGTDTFSVTSDRFTIELKWLLGTSRREYLLDDIEALDGANEETMERGGAVHGWRVLVFGPLLLETSDGRRRAFGRHLAPTDGHAVADRLCEWFGWEEEPCDEAASERA